MKRIFAIALVTSLAAAPALAGESLLSSGVRHAEKIAVTESTATTPLAGARTGVGQKPAASLQEQVTNLSKSSMSRRKKLMIFIGLGVGAAAGMYAIDQNVVDVTPSSQGKRQD